MKLSHAHDENIAFFRHNKIHMMKILRFFDITLEYKYKKYYGNTT